MSSSSSGPPYKRLLHIMNVLNANKNCTAVSLAKELGVGERQVKRYLSYMRKVLGMEIIWEKSTGTYFCERPYEYLPLLRVSGDEALSLALASKTFAAWQGTALGTALDSILKKVSQVIGGAVSVPVSEVQSFLSTPEVGHDDDREHTWFGPLLEAIRRKREIKIRYRKPDSVRGESRTLWPLHLAYLDHQWALVFWDKNKNEPRKFLLSRIEALAPTGAPFTPPAEFDVQEYFKNSFGLFTGVDVFEIEIRFDKFAAPFLRERKWHPSQRLKEINNGGVIARFHLNHLMDIQRWALSWGGHAEVLKPKALRNNIKKELKVLSKNYA
ncbi:MAG: WYL domain-containing protein [Verrucomicrobia bacterium]|nr:WYL domain-containing protein [Verrucomicrobiota bacterium]